MPARMFLGPIFEYEGDPMAKSTVALLITVFLGAVISFAQNEKIKNKPKASSTTSKKTNGGCVYQSEIGNGATVPYANSCPQAMKFTIRWAGGQAPRDVTYRIGWPGFPRPVRRQDSEGLLL